MNILTEITENRKNLLKREKEIFPLSEAVRVAEYNLESGYRPVDFLTNYRSGKPFLIAEIKKASPSKGIICEDFNPLKAARVYNSFDEICAISVLTEPAYFCGSYAYIEDVRSVSSKPVLMKDFIVDEYQVYTGFLAGASAILLIASLLNDSDIQKLSALAGKLSMRVLFETHTDEEYKRALKFDVDLIGINNRNLSTFEVDIENTLKIVNDNGKPEGRLIISESGIKSKQDMEKLGIADGFLIGETFMKNGDPGRNIKEFLAL